MHHPVDCAASRARPLILRLSDVRLAGRKPWLPFVHLLGAVSTIFGGHGDFFARRTSGLALPLARLRRPWQIPYGRSFRAITPTFSLPWAGGTGGWELHLRHKRVHRLCS